jgi:mevalonate kinase
MKIQIPGKIFICGEYAALKGEPALTVAVKPCFEYDSLHTVSAPLADEDSQENKLFHEDSPAGILQAQYQVSLEGRFRDPYKGIGGLGKSTAEFLAVAQKALGLRDEWHLWSQYRKIHEGAENVPSGVDLLTQLKGGYCLTETTLLKSEKIQWPFHRYDWLALITGNKVKTHEHLGQSLNPDWPALKALNRKVISSFESKNADEFIQNLNEWRDLLHGEALEAQATTELVDVFLEVPGVVAAKGCGALGSDIVFIMFDKSQSEALEKAVSHWNHDRIIRSSQVCFEGLKVDHGCDNSSSL